MILDDTQLTRYRDTGYLLLPNVFSAREVALMKHELPSLLAEESPRRVLELNKHVRSVYGAHQTNPVFERLSKHPRIVEPAMQIVGSPVYTYQFKINAKVAFAGDQWDWHQDFIYWKKEDGVLAPRFANVTVFLDEVNEFNGPMTFIPGSHKEGMIDVVARDEQVPSDRRQPYRDSPAWIGNLIAKIKYSVDRPKVAELVTRYGLVAPKGPAGSVLFFHENMVHASTQNLSPFDRAIVIATYNSVDNRPQATGELRPEFLAGRDFSPISPLADNVFD